MRRADNLTTFLNSGSLILLEPSGSVQACNGIALPKGVMWFVSSLLLTHLLTYLLYLLTYLLIPWSTVLHEKLTSFQVAKKFPAFYGPRRFIMAFTSAATCPYPEPARSNLYPTSHFLKIQLIIILPSKPGSPKWSLSLRFPHQNPVSVSSF